MSNQNEKKVRKYDTDYKFIEEYNSIKEARDKNNIARGTMYNYLDSGKALKGYLYFRKNNNVNRGLVFQLKERKKEIEESLEKVEKAIEYFTKNT